MSFSSDFIFGVATASYQIEGAANESGRTPSIWDTFCRIPGRVFDGHNGDTACDHYHRYAEDIGFIQNLGADMYRFSIAWPRIFPEKGVYNPAGMAFYRDLCSKLRENGVRAAATLYHWDLPQWAQELGGWANRECTAWFLDFARKCFEELNGEVEMWITHNEPFCAAFLGHYVGVHAPGLRQPVTALRAAHHILLSHGLAVQLFREMQIKGRIGITLNFTPAYAASNSFADYLGKQMSDGFNNRWFIEPLFRQAYPTDIAALFAARCAASFDFIHEGDFNQIARPIDFLGVNYYTRGLVEYDATSMLLNSPAYSDAPKTDMGWDIVPNALSDLLHMIRGYTSLPVYITENGSAWPDKPEGDEVHDQQRVEYLLRHLETVDTLNDEGMNIKGYFCWSLMDNFEWAFGFCKRFGLIYVDYATQKRIPKDSYFAYRDYIAEKKR